MDEHLQTIANLSAAKFRDLSAAAKSTRELLESKDATAAVLRDKCLSLLQMALQCKHQKINQAAVDLLQTLIRDGRFIAKATTSENDILVMSALKAIAVLPVIKSSPVQCRILTLCMNTYGNAEETSVRLACRAAVTQIFSSFCAAPHHLEQQQPEGHSQEHIAIFMDATALLNEVIKRASVANPQSEQIIILLDAICSILSSQPVTVSEHQPFVNVIWRELSPCLMKMLGEPEKSARDIAEGNEPLGRGQRSTTARSKTIFDHPEVVLSLYQIMEQLLRLLSGVQGMRSVLEAVFHKGLLYPTVDQRSEALRIIRKITGNEERLADIIAVSISTQSLTLWTIIMDCIVECSNSTNIEIASEALRTLQAFLDAASRLCAIDSDGVLSAKLIASILNCFPTDNLPTVSAVGVEAIDDDKNCRNNEEDLGRNGSMENLESTEELKEMLEKLSKKYQSGELNSMVTLRGEDTGKESQDENEIETANYYVNELRNAIPKWLALKSTIEVDEAIQEFASGFFSEFMVAQTDAFELHGQAQSQFLNSDAIYLATYAALAVLYRSDDDETFSKVWFINEVLRSDCIVYSSDRWLSAVYVNLKNSATDLPLRSSDYVNAPLINVIKDSTGFGAQIMSDARRIQQMFIKQTEHSLAASRACRWLVLASWDKILTAPTVLLSFRSRQRRIIRPKVAEASDQAIYTMLSLARLCVLLRLQERNQTVIERLVLASCPLDELRNLAAQEKTDCSSAERFSKWPIRKADVVAMQTVLEIAIDCGLYAPKCWNDIIRCTEYVWEVEKYLFGTAVQEQAINWLSPKSGSSNGSAYDSVISAAQCIDDMLPNDGGDSLNSHTASRIFHLLITMADRFYERVGKELNLASLSQLMQCLTAASENRLQYASLQPSGSNSSGSSLVDPTILLRRLATILMTLSTRPLIHAMKIWPKVTPHMVQCACSRSNEKLNRFAIESLGDCIGKLMFNEANGFCYNQLIFQPLQNILCAEMCSEETQEQIVTLLATFVHSHPNMIGSGWRPLFSALKALRVENHGELEPSTNDLTPVSSIQATVLDIFSAYLSINNTNVLLETILDYITCVLQYLQSTGREEEAVSSSPNITVASTALQNLLKVERMLHDLLDSADCAEPHLLQRLTLRERNQQSVDRYTDASFLVEPLSTILIEEPFFDIEQKTLPTDLDCLLEVPSTTSPWETYTAPMRSCVEVYLSLMEGLTAVTFVCPASLQSNLLRTIADLIRDQVDTKFGINFGAYGLSVLVFPMLQQWMRKDAGEHENNLKQAVGLFTEVVKQYVLQTTDNPWINRAFFDTLTLLTECVTCTSNRIARLGYACLRFLIRSTIHSLTKERWTIVVRCLWNATSLTLAHLRFLMRYYVVDSNDPNGDVGDVRVAAVENANFSCETMLLAQQIFLMDEQIHAAAATISEQEEKKRRVVVLSNDGSEQRIDGQGLVSTLTSHQYILELIGTLLLDGIDLPVDGQTAAFLKKFDERAETDDECNLHKLSSEDIAVLFHCVDASLLVAQNFDKRLGLKMLIQGIFDFPVLPNLCKQAVLAWTIRSLGMYEIVRTCPLKKEAIVELLSSSSEQPPPEDPSGIRQLQLCHRKVCTYLCAMEKKVAMEAIRHLARSHVTQVTLIRDDTMDGDLYKLVSSEETAEIITNYKRSKTSQSLITSAAKRGNPFRGSNEQQQQPPQQQQQDIAEEKLILCDSEIRCYAWVEMSVALLEASLREDNERFEKLLPVMYENAAILISGSANARIREFAGRFLRRLPSFLNSS